MDMVERTAREICAADDWTAREFDDFTRDERARYAAMARAAIAAMREPPIELYKAAAEALVMDHDAYACWHAMIDAALTSSKPQAPSSE